MANQDLGAQAAIQAQINDLFSTRLKQFADQEAALSRQLKLMLGIKEAAQGTAKGVESAKKRLEEVAKSEKKVTEAAEKAAGAQKNFTAELKKAQDESEELRKKLEKVTEIAGAFGDAISGATSSTFGLIKMGGSLIGTLFNVGQAILSVPFKLWDAFVEKSANIPYNPAFLEALKETTKMFGDLSSGAGKKVMDMYHNLRSQQGAMAKESGLSMRKIFGYGVEGRAAMLKFIGEMSQGLGSQLIPIMNQIGDDIGRVTYAIKGMGLSSEDAGAAMKFFYNSGQNASKMIQDMGKTAAMMAKQTGFNIKTLSKAMVETTQAFPQFAKQGVKAMAEVAHYTHNLGIEVKDLQAVFDKFDSFDAAAESASQLSQAFGVQIDAMKMVKEQSPTKRMEELRNAFKAAGKDINSMTTAERKLAEQTLGLSGAAFEAAMGEGNKKKALSESEKAAKAATQAAKDQTAAMKQLAKSIEKIVPPAPTKFKGFFDALSQGFSDGAYYTKNFGGMLRDLQRSFYQVYWLGRDLAKLFFDHFPGMTKIAEGFRKIFNPAAFHRFRKEVVDIFKDFFQQIETDPKAGFQKFFDRLKAALGKIIGNDGLEKMKQGFNTFTSIMGKVLGEAVKKLLEMATEGLKAITDMIKNPNKIADVAGTAGGFASNFFGPILEALKEFGPALGDAFMALMEVAFEKLKPYLEKVAIALATWWAIKFTASMAASLIAMMVKAKIAQIFAAQTQQAMVSAVQQAAAAMQAQTAGTSAATAAAQGGTAAAQSFSLKMMIMGINTIEVPEIIEAGAKLLLLTAVVLANIALFAVGLMGIDAIMPIPQLALKSLMLIPVALGLAALGGALWVLSKIPLDPGSAVKVALQIFLIGLALVALAGLTVILLALITKAPDAGVLASFVAVLGVLIGAITVVGLLSAGLGGLMMIPGFQVAMGAAIVAIALIGAVVVVIAALAIKMVSDIATSMTPEAISKMVDVSKAFAIFSEGLSSMAGAIVKFAFASLLGGLKSGVDAMESVVNVFAEKMPVMVEKLLKSMEKMSPEEVKGKMEAVKALMESLSPMVQIASTLGKVTEEMADEDFKPYEISNTLDKMKQTFDAILLSAQGLITTLLENSKNLSQEQVNSAQAVGSLLGAVGSFLQAVQEPLTKILGASEETIGSNIDPKVLEKNIKAYAASFSAFTPALATLFEVGGPVYKLINLIGGLEGFDKEQAEKVKPFTETLKVMIDAVKTFITAFTTSTDTIDPKTKEKTGTKIAALEGLSDVFDQISSQIFNSETGFMPKLLRSLEGIVIPETAANQLEKVGNFVKAFMDPIVDIVKILPGMMTTMLEASTSNVAGIKSVDTDQLETMKKTFMSMISGMITSVIPVIDKAEPLLQGIMKAANVFKGDPAKLTPKVDLMIKSLEFLAKLGEILSADSPLSSIIVQGKSAKIGDEEVSNLTVMSTNLDKVISTLFGGKNPPIQSLINSMSTLKLGDLEKKGKAEALVKVFDGIKNLLEALEKVPSEPIKIDEMRPNIVALKRELAEKGSLYELIKTIATEKFYASKGLGERGENLKTLFSNLSEIIPSFDNIVALVAAAPVLDHAKFALLENFATVSLKNFITRLSTLKTSNITNTMTQMRNLQTFVGKYQEVSKAVTAIPNPEVMEAKLTAMTQNLSKVFTGIASAAGSIDAKSIKPLAQAVAVLSKFKGGTLEVTHNIPGVRMEVNVNIDATRLGKEIVMVDVSKDPTKGGPRTVATKTGKHDPDVGM